MEKLTVVSVAPFTPGDDSASVTLSSGYHEIVAFCWPCNLNVGDVIENRLSAMNGNTVAAYLADWPEKEKRVLSSEWIAQTGDYSYQGRGRVIDEVEGLVKVMGFVIDFGEILGRGHVDFDIERLNI